jgi:hypothetical protein
MMMKGYLTGMLVACLIQVGAAGAYPLDTARLVEITSTNQVIAFVRGADRVELEFSGPTGWSRDGKQIDRPADVYALTNAQEIKSFVGRMDLAPNPTPCCCGHQCCIIFWQGDRSMLASICGKCFTAIYRNAEGKRTVAHLRMPPAVWESFGQYRLLHRKIEGGLLGVTTGTNGVLEIIWQGRWKPIYTKVGDEIEGFRVERYDGETQRVLLRCPKTGREVWMK